MKKTYTGDAPELGDIVGMPDEWDKKNIQVIINKWEKRFPNEIRYLVAQSRAEMETEGRILRSDRDKIQFSREMSIPAGLIDEIKLAYPLMFRDRKHFAWFMRHFPQFVVKK